MRSESGLNHVREVLSELGGPFFCTPHSSLLTPHFLWSSRHHFPLNSCPTPNFPKPGPAVNPPETLISAERIQQRVDELARQMNARLRGPQAHHRRRADRQPDVPGRPDASAGPAAADRTHSGVQLPRCRHPARLAARPIRPAARPSRPAHPDPRRYPRHRPHARIPRPATEGARNRRR